MPIVSKVMKHIRKAHINASFYRKRIEYFSTTKYRKRQVQKKRVKLVLFILLFLNETFANKFQKVSNIKTQMATCHREEETKKPLHKKNHWLKIISTSMSKCY